MFYLVYKITNSVNGMHYIGAHKTDRIDDGYSGSGIRLRQAIAVYGIGNFTKNIVFQASTIEEMLAKETELIEISDDSYNTRKEDRGYNLHKPDTIQKMRIAASLKTAEKNSQFGTKWINNGVDSKKLRYNKPLPDGWTFGRINGNKKNTHFVKLRNCESGGIW